MDVPPRTVAHEGPLYHRPLARPDYLTRYRPTARSRCHAAPTGAEELRAALLEVLAAPNIASKARVTDQ